MSPTQTFIRAWRTWLQSQVPSENFQRGRTNAPTYNIELELDHLHSRLHSLGSAFIEGKSWDYAKLASDELADLDRIVLDLEGCSVPEGEKDFFRNYVSLARSLLAEMMTAFSVNGAV